MPMNRVRITPTNMLKIEKFSGGVGNVFDTKSVNMVMERYSDGSVYVTQRPGFNIQDDASTATTDISGRGVYYWQALGDNIIVNNDTVYRGGYSLALATLISAGKNRVYFAESGSKLLIVDPENNEGWTMDTSTPSTITKITDVDFPPNQTPALSLARGAVALNGTFYVMDTNGTIWNSAVDDPTTWTATDFIEAEFETDGGVGIAQHHDSIVALGSKTIEFFNDAANPTGSPLRRRSDINYRVGCVAQDVFTTSQDNLFFIGISEGGHVGIYSISGYQLAPVNNDGLSSLLSSAIFTDNMFVSLASFSLANSTMLVVTTSYDMTTYYSPQQSFVWDSSTQMWLIWQLSQTGYATFPIVAWATGKTTVSNAGQGQTITGDIVTIADDYGPQDLTLAAEYVVVDYVETGYISDTQQSGTDITFEYQFGRQDFGVRARKRHHSVRLDADEISSGTITLNWADDQNQTFAGGRTIDASQASAKIRRLGISRQRNYKVSGTLSDQFRLSGIEAEISGAVD